MRYSAEHKQDTHARILAAAGQLFRTEGYGGSGIDGLTKLAGVTNGGFYGHFKSKREAFRAAVLAGLEELRAGIAELKAAKGRQWPGSFVRFYLGAKRTCALGEGCALSGLSVDVMRADARTRSDYEVELRRIIDEMASGLVGGSPVERRDEAIALLAVLAGGVMISRAVADGGLADRIAGAVQRHALAMVRHDR